MKHMPIALGLLAVFSACSAEKKDDETSTAAKTTTTTDGGIAAVEDVGSLKLSNLKIELPAALDGGSATLRLAGGKKSVEACQMGQTIKEVTSRVGSVASFACHIEIEKDKIVFGKKTKITFLGQEFGRLLVLKEDDKISFAMCQNGEGRTNKQLIEVTKVTDAGPAGSIYEIGSQSEQGETQSWTSKMSFDFSTSGTLSMDSTDRFLSGSNEFLRAVKLSIKDEGVSTVALASKGSWQGQTFAQRGAGRFNGTYGQTLFENSGTSSYQGVEQTFSFANRSYFDENGVVVSDTATDAFAAPSGELYITKADVPVYLTDSSAITAPAGWVADGCPDIDVSVELNPGSPAHEACNSDHEHTDTNCWDQGSFEQGTATQDLD